MKKKFLTIAMGMTLAAFMLSGCSSSASDKGTEAETTAIETEASEEEKAEEETEAKEEETEAEAAEADAEGAEEFIVGFDQDFPPMGFIGDDGEYTGFDLDLAKEVADRLGMKFVAQPIAWDAKDMELESGAISCIWNGFTIEGREDAYTWSDPYMNNSQVFVVKNDSGIKSSADLAGKVVEVQIDSSGQKALESNKELSDTFGELLTTPDYNTAFMDLEQGAVDAICMDVIVAGYQIQQRNAEMTILDESVASETYGVGFKKGNEELRDKVNDTLKEMAADGTLAEISTKWFTKDVTTIK